MLKGNREQSAADAESVSAEQLSGSEKTAEKTSLDKLIAAKIVADRRLTVVCLAFLLLLGGVIGCRYGIYLEQHRIPSDDSAALVALHQPSVQADAIAVHVIGAVQQPGLYYFSSTARVADAITAAGGATDEADLNTINLAAYLEDAQQLLIPAFASDSSGSEQSNDGEDYTAAEGTVRQSTAESGKININTATSAQLQRLNGIGEVKAAAIIAYREKNGAFSDISQIKRVSGIGDATYEKIKDYICVE